MKTNVIIDDNFHAMVDGSDLGMVGDVFVNHPENRELAVALNQALLERHEKISAEFLERSQKESSACEDRIKAAEEATRLAVEKAEDLMSRLSSLTQKLTDTEQRLAKLVLALGKIELPPEIQQLLQTETEIGV